MIVTIDFETFYSKEYSLSRMSEYQYILDPRFETIGCAIKLGGAHSDMYYGHEAVAAALAKIDWSRAALCCHNTRFDGSILAWIYGHQPKLYLDTLSMARAIVAPYTGRVSLKKCSEYFDLPAKGDYVHNMCGRTLASMSAAELVAYGEYCMRDNENCYAIFKRMRRCFSASELSLIDIMLRMYIEPVLQLEPYALAEHYGSVKAERQAAFDRVAHIDKSVFSSNAKFKALLEEHGVDVPMKISKSTGQMIPALAKNDREFKEMCDDTDLSPTVQALLAARVGAKSTLEETRTAKLLGMASFVWPGASNGAGVGTAPAGAGWLPVPMRYYGAHTGRGSHDGGINLSNMKRASGIRKGIKAPSGYRIVYRDSSQIEARMNAWLAGCQTQLDAFAQGRDLYSEFASSVYGYQVDKKLHPGPRFVGKTGILSLGYQAGPERFRHMLFIGNGGMSYDIDLKEAKRIVYRYRNDYKEIPTNNWAAFSEMIHTMALNRQWRHFSTRTSLNVRARHYNPRFEILDFMAEGIILPNGLGIAYPDLRTIRDPSDPVQTMLVYDGAFGDSTNIYGGKVTENVVQGLARIVVTDVAVRVKRDTDYVPALFTHDALAYVVPEHEADTWDRYLETEFTKRTSWAPDLPLASEGGWGLTLAQAEAHENQ
jgi:DNA polymerase